MCEWDCVWVGGGDTVALIDADCDRVPLGDVVFVVSLLMERVLEAGMEALTVELCVSEAEEDWVTVGVGDFVLVISWVSDVVDDFDWDVVTVMEADVEAVPVVVAVGSSDND